MHACASDPAFYKLMPFRVEQNETNRISAYTDLRRPKNRSARKCNIIIYNIYIYIYIYIIWDLFSIFSILYFYDFRTKQSKLEASKRTMQKDAQQSTKPNKTKQSLQRSAGRPLRSWIAAAIVSAHHWPQPQASKQE